jgi:hypothetical protein
MTTKQMLGLLSDPGIDIPAGVGFESLKLQLSPDGIVYFDGAVLLQVWVESGYAPELLPSLDAVEVCRFIARWYFEHMRRGGASDPMHIQLMAFLLGRKNTNLHVQAL